MKTVIFTIIICLALFTGAQAQCVVCLEDNTCIESALCDGADCSSTTFTVPTSGNYTLVVVTVCESGYNCFDCYGCATVFKQTGYVSQGAAQTHYCFEEDCSDQTAFNLVPNTTYELYVCKARCTGQTCDDCPEECKAKACVYLTTGGSGCIP